MKPKNVAAFGLIDLFLIFLAKNTTNPANKTKNNVLTVINIIKFIISP
jgi:hypothetical protein